MVWFARRLAVWFVVAALASSGLATCLMHRSHDSEAMACCMTDDRDCGPSTQTVTCCTNSSDTTAAVLATKPGPPVKLIALLLPEMISAGGAIDSVAIRPHSSALTSSSSPPVFLLTSSLRI
jgi:hypothetical protein